MADRVGQNLGNYHLIRLLGRGGFAEVYLGEHLRLGTQAAVKVLHTRLASQDDVEGFEKEARTVAHLKHPHIVRVLDYDVEEDTPFLVMDCAPGGTLRHRHPKGTRLPLTTIIAYVKEVAAALQYAHDQRIIHRDVKPENMLVGERDDLLLSDFGISIVAQSSRYQHTQQMGGTMAYIAPEQIQGHPRPASDQYSLGIVVYEWLSGNCPFHGSMTEIVAQHLAASPPPLQEKVPTIASEVEQVVLTALEKDPRKRFSSVVTFATALEQAYRNTQASHEIPAVSLPPPAPVIEPGTQDLQAERSLAERPPSPEQPAFQSLLQSTISGTLPSETPAEAPAFPSSPTLLPTIPARGLPLADEPRTGRRTRQQAPEIPRNAQLATTAPGSSRPRSHVMPPRRMLIAGMSIVVAGALLLAALLGRWFVTPELAHTPGSELTTTAIPGSTPTPTATLGPVGIITEFSIPTAQSAPVAIIAGHDGNLWFTEPDGNKIGRISPNGTITEISTPTVNSSPYGITVGSDGNIWFAEDASAKIGRISQNGTISEFPTPPAQNSRLYEIVAGHDGNLWFIEASGDKIGRISPSGTITEFSIPVARSSAYDISIAAGAGGTLWFTEASNDKIGRISPDGTITEFSIPTPQSSPYDITAGPDGNLWFFEGKGNKVGRISPDGTITEFSIPTPQDAPNFMVVGPDGSLWLTQPNGNQIGRVSPGGTVTEFPIPTVRSDPFAITVGPDGNLWFTEWSGNKIGRITSGRGV